MRIRKFILTLGATSLLALPFVTISCSRYNVQKHNQIVQVLKTYATNNKYLANVSLPAKIKIPSQSTPIAMTYELEKLAGVINWSTKIDNVDYSDTLGGWKQYPTIEVPNPTSPNTWGTALQVSGFSSKLQLVLFSNSYTVEQNINIDTMKKSSKSDISDRFTSVFQNIIDKKMVDRWVNVDPSITKPSSVQKTAIEKAKNQISPALPNSSDIDSWFQQFNINVVNCMFSITNKSTPGINSALLNYSTIPYKSTIKDKREYLTNWATADESNFKAIFNSFTHFTFDDFLVSIKNIK